MNTLLMERRHKRSRLGSSSSKKNEDDVKLLLLGNGLATKAMLWTCYERIRLLQRSLLFRFRRFYQVLFGFIPGFVYSHDSVWNAPLIFH